MQKKDQTTQELFSIITEPSTIQGIKETLKLCMDSLKSNTLNTLLKQDADYQTALLEYRQAHQHYQDTDFKESQRDTIDTLLARRDESEIPFSFPHSANRLSHNSIRQQVMHITHSADYYGIPYVFT